VSNVWPLFDELGQPRRTRRSLSGVRAHCSASKVTVDASGGFALFCTSKGSRAGGREGRTLFVCLISRYHNASQKAQGFCFSVYELVLFGQNGCVCVSDVCGATPRHDLQTAWQWSCVTADNTRLAPDDLRLDHYRTIECMMLQRHDRYYNFLQ
jgi:hypothetical protein